MSTQAITGNTVLLERRNALLVQPQPNALAA